MKNVLEFKYHKIVEGYYDIRDNLTPRNLVPSQCGANFFLYQKNVPLRQCGVEVKIAGNLLFVLFRAGSFDCFSGLKQLQKHSSDFTLFFMVFSNFENFHK